MKYIFSTLLFGALAATASAQITLSQNDIGPFGRKMTVKVDDTNPSVSAGNAGANQSWTVGVLGEDIVDTFTFVNPAFTPYGNEFPSADIAMTTSSGVYGYATLNAAGFSLIGQRDAFAYDYTYTNPETVLDFPLAYQSTYSDSSQTVLQLYLGFDPGIGQTVDSVRTTTDVYKSGTVDAWGTLTMPSGSSSVLRLNTLRHETALTEYLVNGTWIPAGPSSSDSSRVYSFWANNTGAPLLELTEDLASNTITEAQYITSNTTVTGISETPDVSTSIFPNPVIDKLHITTRMSNYNVSLFDAQGRLVLSENATAENYELNVSSLEAGTYFLRMTDSNGKVRQEKICITH